VRFSGFKVKNQNLGNKIKSLDRLPLGYHFPDFQSVLALTAGGVTSLGERSWDLSHVKKFPACRPAYVTHSAQIGYTPC